MKDKECKVGDTIIVHGRKCKIIKSITINPSKEIGTLYIYGDIATTTIDQDGNIITTYQSLGHDMKKSDNPKLLKKDSGSGVKSNRKYNIEYDEQEDK